MTFLENGTKIYALNPKTFVFVPEKSAGNPEVDIVRTVNIPFVVSYGVSRGELCHCDLKCEHRFTDAYMSFLRVNVFLTPGHCFLSFVVTF